MDETAIWGGVVVIIGSLAAAVTTLWRNAEGRNAKLIAQQEKRITALQKMEAECEKDRIELRERIVRLEVLSKCSRHDETESEGEIQTEL